MRNKIFMIISFLAVTVLLSSCLKDNVGEDWTSTLKGKMYAEFPNNGAQVNVIQPVATDQIFKFLINVATDALPTTDITLTLAFDPAAMAAYNTELHTADPSLTWSYELYPTMTIVEPTITIAKGTRNAYVHVKLTGANLLSLSKKFMAPITITDASGGVIIAANRKTVLYKLPIANKWEGTYKMKGYVLRDPYPDYTGFFKNRTMKLATAGPNSVQMATGLLWAGTAGSTSGIGGIGKWEITISESATPNPITLVDPDNAAVKLLTTYPSRYDPAVRTFYMSVYWGTGPTNRAITDTMVYSGPY
jgi:hypothetical protein